MTDIFASLTYKVCPVYTHTKRDSCRVPIGVRRPGQQDNRAVATLSLGLLHLWPVVEDSPRGAGSPAFHAGPSCRPHPPSGGEALGLSPPSHACLPPLAPLPIRPTPLPPLLSSPPRPLPPPVKRLTPEELTSRREHGLCFNYNEKYQRGHHCTSRVLLLIAKEDDPSCLLWSRATHTRQPGSIPGPNKFKLTFGPPSTKSATLSGPLA